MRATSSGFKSRLRHQRILFGGALTVLAGRFAMRIGLVTVVGFPATGDMPPLVAHLPTGRIGLVIQLVPS